MSLDFSEKKQLAYMRHASMPWLAVSFPNLKSSGLFEFAGCVMPWISVFKADGTCIPNGKLNLVDHTPEQVLAELESIIAVDKKNAGDKKSASENKVEKKIVAL